jgi:hypothetical protein
MQEKPMCSICEAKECVIVMTPHWRTGEMLPFHGGTCGDPKCVKEYDQLMLEAELWIDGHRDYSYDGYEG